MSLAPAPSASGAPHRTLAVLLLVAAVLFTANAARLALPPLDDCFYARKGVEMGRAGGFFTVTWNGIATFQNPPLQFWILGRSFALLGENDLAARLPFALMALGLLALTWRIGRLTVGTEAALDAVALLMITPLFLQNARRCMLDLPFAQWSAALLWLWLEGLRRPRLHLLLALPLGAALLTKSVLALVPLAALPATALVLPAARRALARPWAWAGVVGGLGIGASWPAVQYARFGAEALRAHYLGEIVTRSLQPMGVAERIYGYPLLLLRHYEPLAVLAIGGAVLLVRRRHPPALVPVLWCAVPLVLCSASAAHSARYLFPVLPGLALCAAAVLGRAPRAGWWLRTRIVPALALAGALVFWFAPQWLGRQETLAFKQQQQALEAAIPSGSTVAYAGARYWATANPLLYYAERPLARTRSVREALAFARERPGTVILSDRDSVATLRALAPGAAVLLAQPRWSLVGSAPLPAGADSTTSAPAAAARTPRG